jgi:PDZ domain-containing protein
MQCTLAFNSLRFRMPPGHTVVILDPSWLVVLPVGLWALVTLYVPILGGNMSPAETWAVALFVMLLVTLSLFSHLLAHFYAARRLGAGLPQSISLLIFGDTAQSWPVAGSAWRESWLALAGLPINLLLAGLFYLLWNAQWNPLLNLSMLFACFFNLWLVVINLIPGFPFDGGRLARAFFSGLVKNPQTPSRLGARLGYLTAAATFLWGVFLLAQQVRFSWQTGVVTIAFAFLVLEGLRAQPVWQSESLALEARIASRRFLRAFLAGLLLVTCFGVPSSLVLTNNGMEAPGLALSTDPMVEVPASHRYPQAGSFILTTVIPQAPITAGEWLVGQLTPAVRIVPPASIVPESLTPQEVAQQGFQMLDESESTAIVVGLQQAGYKAVMVGKGVRVISIESGSRAQGLLQPGDVIIALDGKPIRTTNDLIDLIQSQSPNAVVQLQVDRLQQKMDLKVPLMPPSSPGEPPKIGISIASAGSQVSLPFPVKIVPQKIVGGPSAGLMFALTVYNAVTPGDLTGGRKIAGTGTINLDGSVGPIGGVEQKVVAAELVGASYFLSPPENYAAARSVARYLQVVEIVNIAQAIEFLHSVPPIKN